MEKRGSRIKETMQLPNYSTVRDYRAVRRHLRRARRRKFRNRRRAVAGLFTAVLLYLTAIGAVHGWFFDVTSEQTFQYILPQDADGSRTVLRITFRLRTGEILIYREESEIHNTAPPGLIN